MDDGSEMATANDGDVLAADCESETTMTTGVHWFEFSTTEAGVNECIDVLKMVVDGDYELVDKGMLGYENQSIGPGGARILSSVRRAEVHVILPGQWCEGAGERIGAVIGFGYSRGKVTRLDLASDDFTKAKSPVEVRDMVRERACVVSHAQRWRLLESDKGGCTFYLGSPVSIQQLRVYDKSVESLGETDAIRWELQERDEYAHQMAGELLASQDWGAVFASWLVRCIDFREPGDSNTARRPRCDWFKALVGAARKAKVACAVPIQTLEDAMKWLQHSVFPTLSAVVSATSLHWLMGGLRKGVDRWGVRHRLLAAARSPDWASCGV